MANLRRLIDLDKIDPIYFPSTEMDGIDVVRYLNTLPTVDAVPVDEIRVDFMSICLENQEAILNVSICGKPNEVKLPFSKDVAEVVHGRWAGYHEADIGYDEYGVRCSNCNFEVEDNKVDFIMNYCPNCGAKMDGEGIMAKCKDCLHYEACSNFSKIINSAVDVETGCEHFKNRTDFTEVVRCKDCKYGIWDEEEQMWECVVSAFYSDNDNNYFTLREYNKEEHFCSYGERKNDG